MKQRRCSCGQDIAHITTAWHYNITLIGGGVAEQLVGPEWQLTGHCGNGCQPVNLGAVKYLDEASRRFPNAIIREATNVTR